LFSNRRQDWQTMKKFFELILCILHPIAVVLIWVTLPSRDEPKGFLPKHHPIRAIPLRAHRTRLHLAGERR
jgi:hypothetical protein